MTSRNTVTMSDLRISDLRISATQSRSAPALIPNLPDALVSTEIVVKLVKALGPSLFFELRFLNSSWREEVSKSPQWGAFGAQKAQLGHDLYVARGSRLRAYLLELRSLLGQAPPSMEMGPVAYYTFVNGLETGDIGEKAFIEAFELAAVGKLIEEDESHAQTYWWEENIDVSTTRDGA